MKGIDFYRRSEDYISEEEKTTKDALPLETRKKFSRPTPDGKFITAQLDDNLNVMRIGANLPPAKLMKAS
ncbi:hypothetical protein A2U01_0026665 [Trifolium medium]|uniref:Uncharacterized protein n=1 Tax=Trifolium medium TaxID=97028 RepID=A0A392P1J7_9FABA|nr:hypothetical protein [Trifolium medium]